MKMSNLFKALKEQYEFLQAYLGTLTQHQKAIISGNVNELEETIKSEGALLLIVENYQNKIMEIIKHLSGEYGLGLKSFKLTEFISALDEGNKYDTDNLIKMKNSLVKLSAEVLKVNNQNKILVDQARYLIKETMTAMVNYKNVSILDRTI